MDEFINKYNLSSIDVDGSCPNQCVDLAKAWEDWNGWPRINGNAKDQLKNISDFYDFVANTPDGYPSEGSLVIWGMAPYGHIAVACKGCTSSKLITFDQNWPTDLRCRIVNHNYKNVIGWIRPKREDNMTYDLFGDRPTGNVYERLNNYALVHLPDPEFASRYYGANWNDKVKWVDDVWSVGWIAEDPRPLKNEINNLRSEKDNLVASLNQCNIKLQTIPKEIIKEVEKVVEVKVPVEITKEIIKQAELTDEEKTYISIGEKIKNIINKLRDVFTRKGQNGNSR